MWRKQSNTWFLYNLVIIVTLTRDGYLRKMFLIMYNVCNYSRRNLQFARKHLPFNWYLLETLLWSSYMTSSNSESQKPYLGWVCWSDWGVLPLQPIITMLIYCNGPWYHNKNVGRSLSSEPSYKFVISLQFLRYYFFFKHIF